MFEAPPPIQGYIKSFVLLLFKGSVLVLPASILIALTAWGSLALYFLASKSKIRSASIAVLFGMIGLAALAGLTTWQSLWAKIAMAAFILAFASILIWWNSLSPSNSRDWQVDVARLSTATIDGDLVTIRNVRNLDYRTEKDFTPRYYDKTYDLKKLDSVDMISVYWMGPAIAHVFLSFGFAGEDYVAFSIETRKEIGEDYSAIKGFFRQYELYYLVADERDVIRVRTDFRVPEEQVYLYRTAVTPENARILFLEYMRAINRLAEKAEFYNALTSNCTTNIVLHARGFSRRVGYHWKILLSGYADKYLYDIGGIDSRLEFKELKRLSLINERAHEAKDAPDFSQRIRKGLPTIEP